MTTSEHGRRSTTADVSIVIAARNARAVVGGALASIAGQAVRPAEVVVVDDGSDDDTSRAVLDWSDRLPIVLLRNDAPRGPGHARARGAAAASTRFLTFLDADDVLLPNHLEALLRTHAQSGGIVRADAVLWSPASGRVEGTFHQWRPVPLPPDQRRGIVRHNFLLIASLLERDVYESIGGFREEHAGAEDWDLWLRLVHAGHVVHRSSLTYVYRQSPASLSRDVRTAQASLTLVEEVMPGLLGDERRVAEASARELAVQLHRARALAGARGAAWDVARREARQALLLHPTRPDLRSILLAIAPRRAAALAGSRADARWALDQHSAESQPVLTGGPPTTADLRLQADTDVVAN